MTDLADPFAPLEPLWRILHYTPNGIRFLGRARGLTADEAITHFLRVNLVAAASLQRERLRAEPAHAGAGRPPAGTWTRSTPGPAPRSP